MDAIQILEDLIVICERTIDKKNVKRSNDEIDKIIETKDKEIAPLKDEWFLESEELKEIKVTGSLRDRKTEKSSSVQTFVNALNDAYGAVSYLRCDYDHGYYGVSIIASKTKVAP